MLNIREEIELTRLREVHLAHLICCIIGLMAGGACLVAVWMGFPRFFYAIGVMIIALALIVYWDTRPALRRIRELEELC
jgi:hypothetical protein